MTQQPFERHQALASWIERLANSQTGLSLGEWMVFLGALNDALLDASRTEGRGEGEPVAWQEAAEPFFRLAREVINPVNGERPWHADSKDWMVVFSFAGQSVTLGDLRRAAVASPIREPEISREAVDIEKVLRQATIDYNKGAAAPGVGIHEFSAQRVSAILNLAPVGGRTYQARVDEWVLACFGEEVARDVRERNHRFLEESLELVQSNGCTASEAHQLVDYVFGRPVGEPGQEVGGVMNTLAALCNAAGLDLNGEAERELARVWTKVEQIRAKHASKPNHSPLPGLPPSNEESQTNGS